MTLLSERLVGAPLLGDVTPRVIYSNEFSIPFVEGDSENIPQGWSIGVEIVFYVFAPLLMLLGRRRVWPLAALAVAATALFVVASLTAPDARYVDNVIYKNAVTSAHVHLGRRGLCAAT